MAILRENRLAQLATVDQQRELMRYMRGLNEWLERDVRDRQQELRGVMARVDQIRAEMRAPQPQQPPIVVTGGTDSSSSAGGGDGGQPPVIPGPAGGPVIPPEPFRPGFVPYTGGLQPVIPPLPVVPPVVPTDAGFPVIPPTATGQPFIPPGMPQPGFGVAPTGGFGPILIQPSHHGPGPAPMVPQFPPPMQMPMPQLGGGIGPGGFVPADTVHPFIPPDYGGRSPIQVDPTIVPIGVEPSASSDSGDSEQPRRRRGSRRPRSERDEDRSPSPRRGRSRTRSSRSGSETPPRPIRVVGDAGLAGPSTMAPQPIIINTGGQPSAVPPPVQVVPSGYIPAGSQAGPPTVIIRDDRRSRRDSRSRSTESDRSRSRSPSRRSRRGTASRHGTSRRGSRSPTRIVIEHTPSRRSRLSRSRSRSRSRSPRTVIVQQPPPAPGLSGVGTMMPPMMPPQQPQTIIVRSGSRSRSRSSSGGRSSRRRRRSRTPPPTQPIIIGGTQAPPASGYMPTVLPQPQTVPIMMPSGSRLSPGRPPTDITYEPISPQRAGTVYSRPQRSMYDAEEPLPVPGPSHPAGAGSGVGRGPSVVRVPSQQPRQFYDREGRPVGPLYDSDGNMIVPGDESVYDTEGRQVGGPPPRTPTAPRVSGAPSEAAPPPGFVPVSASSRSVPGYPIPPPQPILQDTGRAYDTSGPMDQPEVSFAPSPVPVRPLPAAAVGRAASPGADRYRFSTASPRATATPFPIDLTAADAERARVERLDEVEGQLQEAMANAREAEDEREREFRQSEEERQRLFFEHEERRDREMRERAEAMLAGLAPGHVPPGGPGASPIPGAPFVPGASPGLGPEPELIFPTEADAGPSGKPPSRAGTSPRTRPQTAYSYRPGDVDDTAAEGASMHTMETAASQAASITAGEIRDIVASEREAMEAELAEMRAERNRLEAERDAARQAVIDQKENRVRELEAELATLKGELDDERAQRQTESAEAAERERQAFSNNDDIRAQLGDITNIVQDSRNCCEEQKTMLTDRWKADDEYREQKDFKYIELKSMVQKVLDDMDTERGRMEDFRLAEAAKPDLEKIIEDLRQQNAEQRDLLNTLLTDWRNDSLKQHEATLDAVRSTAREQVDFNVQGYLDEFSKALASEVRMLLGEVGKLREERRALQHELGYLLTMKSKYGPGGEFEPDWKPPTVPGGPPDPGPPPPPPDLPPAKPGWRTVAQRSAAGGRKPPKKKEAAPGPPPPGPPPAADPRRQVQSWATWQPDPAMAPTPPSREATLLVPEQPPTGLFGPRTPRSSYHA
ncbi:PH domain-containing protein [Mycena chlorophos]|uniref:PH domain-containing protein n=1 Tax=Mycena chlorophos TaxID=658473 RepID=A0A8H6TLJ6_MYCCL|nr:PH domain-containing protein [Mycena chlorophos]